MFKPPSIVLDRLRISLLPTLPGQAFLRQLLGTTEPFNVNCLGHHSLLTSCLGHVGQHRGRQHNQHRQTK